MKHKIFRNSLLFGVILIVISGCTKLLEEQPRTSFTPSFFTTADGSRAALQVSIRASEANGLHKFGHNYLMAVRMKLSGWFC
jgi:hypothetical protein